MPSLNEATSAAQAGLNPTLQAGVDLLSEDAKFTFTKYIKTILPLDGYVFYVKASLVAGQGRCADLAIDVQGSLHYSSDSRQNEDESISYNKVIFTTSQEIQAFNQIAPSVLYIAQYRDIWFSFSARGKLYKAASLFHYTGDAVFPVMEDLIIDTISDLPTTLIVSNSLPIWLSMQAAMPMYPSFAVPDNLRPPYAAVHIPPESTRAIQSAPFIDATSSHWQLVADTVRVTIYGNTNDEIMNFVDYVNAFSLSDDVLGIMNMPVPRDEKRTQNEMNVLALKKTIIYEVNYNQASVRDLARQYILSCIPSFLVA